MGIGLVQMASRVAIAFTAVSVAVGAAVLAMRPFINASIEMENAMLGLETVARAFGVSANEANEAAQSLSEDGLMTVREAAEGLKNLLATGFSLPQAIKLMEGFKDSAAFNRQGMLKFGEAIVGATQGLKNQNSIMVDNAGITKNLSVILKEAGLSTDDLGRITSDASVRTKLYNGLLKEMSIFLGDSEKMAGTLGGKLTALGKATWDLSVVIGDAMRPAVEALASVLGDILIEAMAFVQKHTIKLQYVFLGLGIAVRATINMITGALRILKGAIMSVVTLSWDPLVDAAAGAYADFQATATSAMVGAEKIAKSTMEGQVDAVESGAKKMSNAMSDKTKKMIKDLEKETAAYEREIAKRQKIFQRQLEDLIWAHLDKKEQLEEDLAEENADFAQKMEDRVRDFDEAMEEMVKRHREKVDDIKEQIEEELEDQEEADEKRLKKLEERLRKEKQALDQLEGDEKARLDAKIANLKRNYEYELAAGKGNEEDLFYELQDRIQEEKAISRKHVEDLVGYKEEELARVRAEEQAKIDEERAEEAERLAELRENLDKEVLEHQEALTKKEEVFTRETTRMKEEHTKRVLDLQERLNKEKEILGKHQGDVSAMKGKVKDDDITRLKNQFAEERAEAEADHLRKMQEVKERGGAEGEAYGGAIGGGLSPKLDEINKMMEDGGKTAGENFADGIKKGAKKAAKELITGFIDEIGSQVRAVPEYLREVVLPKIGITDERVRKYFGIDRQTGGIVPGPVGEPVPIMAHGQERVIPAGISQDQGGRDGGGISFNVNVGLYAGAETEKREIARELYASLVQVATSRNQNVQQLMGG
jgi:hypothetical protein